MPTGWESQLVIGQFVWPRATEDSDSQVLVDHDHDKASMSGVAIGATYKRISV
jgi:hypothetical protein